MGIIDAIRGALSHEPSPHEKGRIVAQEAAKQGIYAFKDASIIDQCGVQGPGWSDFVDGMTQEAHKLAIEAGRVYCATCDNYYLPHEH